VLGKTHVVPSLFLSAFHFCLLQDEIMSGIKIKLTATAVKSSLRNAETEGERVFIKSGFRKGDKTILSLPFARRYKTDQNVGKLC
jgi:hypothetical protein